ncbi:MAG: MBL fold metallo-hydrolase, partial [Bacteroidota bacterium]
DDIRAYNYFQGEPMKLYCNEQVEVALRREFHYAFNEFKYPGAPEIEIKRISNNQQFSVGDISFTPIELLHYKLPVLGFRIGDFVYITDANFISEQEKKKLFGCQYLVLNALRKEKHISHFTLSEAIELSTEINPKQTYFTHISHQLGLHKTVNRELPHGFQLAYDGLELLIETN